MGKNKRKVLLIVAFVIALTLSITYINFNQRKEEENITASIAVYIDDGSGYKLSSSKEFPSTGYQIDYEKSSCTNDGKITQNGVTRKISVKTSNQGKCNLYFEKSSSVKTLNALGLTSKTGLPNFNNVATTDETANGLYSMEDDYGTSYYFRGAVKNNYVKFGKWGDNIYRGYRAESMTALYKEYSSLNDCQDINSYNFGCEQSLVSGKDMYWRIIRINGDGSIRMIYDGTEPYDNGEDSLDRLIGTTDFNTVGNDNAYIGYMFGLAETTTDANRCLMLENATVTDKKSTYTTKSACDANGGIWTTTAYEATHANVKDSSIKKYLDYWYKTNLVDSGYAEAISDGIFCNDREIVTDLENSNNGTYSSYTVLGYGLNNTIYMSNSRVGYNISNSNPQLKCTQKNDAFTAADTIKGNGKLTYPIGLITADEAAAAGGKYSNANNNYYLYKGVNYYSLSPIGFGGSAGLIYIYSSGTIAGNNANNLYTYMAPVINLSPEYAKTLKGTGTMTDPFRLE